MVCASAIVVAGCVVALTTGPMPYFAGAAHNLLRIVNLTKATGYDTRAIATVVAVLPMATALSTDKSTVHQHFEHR